MPDETVEALRLLTNLETESEKLFQVVLFGQPELDNKLNQYGLRQLKQRITYSHYLKKLSAKEVRAYINFRLQAAGHTSGALFERDAAEQIAEASMGVPRLVNILSHKALLVAFGKGDDRVVAEYVRRAVDDTQGVRLSKRNLVREWLPAVAAVIVVACVTWTLTILGMSA